MKRIFKYVRSLDFREPVQSFWYRLPVGSGSDHFRLWLYCQTPGTHRLILSATSENRAEVLANQVQVSFETQRLWLSLPLTGYSPPDLVKLYKETKNKFSLSFQAKPGRIIRGIIQREVDAEAKPVLSQALPPVPGGNEKEPEEERLIVDLYLECKCKHDGDY